jgi:hypothetical protein
MTDLSTLELTVEEGARIFESVEGDLKKVHDRILKLLAVIEAARGFILFGKLEAGICSGMTQEASGDVGKALRTLFELHRRLTDHCITAGVDLPQAADGGR